MAIKIYTKTGDKGETSLLGGTRVPKHHLRIEAYGTVDELNAYIGLLRDQDISNSHKDALEKIQNTLFVIGANLATAPEKTKTLAVPAIREDEILLLEKEIDKMTEALPALKSFILPGGHTTVSYCHITRCVCRRAERITVRLAESSPVSPVIVKYLNRLSDYLFVLARKLSAGLHVPEIPWKSGR